MAVTWDVKITPLDVARKEASVVAMRTDNTDPANIKTETISVLTCTLANATEKADVLNNIWAHHLAYQMKQSQIAAYIGGLETQAKANLEAREV